LKPLPIALSICRRDGDDIETTRIIAPSRVRRQKMACRANDSPLFPHRYRFGATAEIASAAQSHFDENQLIAMQHNQIDFAALAAKILFDADQSLLLQP
jgi:hypothetical protein